MATMRRFRVNCPKCNHPVEFRDDGGLDPKEAEKRWKAFDEAFKSMDRAFDTMRRLWRGL